LVQGRSQKADINFALAQRIILKAGEHVSALDLNGGQPFAVFEYNSADHTAQP
jgi:hypothetical protein